MTTHVTVFTVPLGDEVETVDRRCRAAVSTWQVETYRLDVDYRTLTARVTIQWPAIRRSVRRFGT